MPRKPNTDKGDYFGIFPTNLREYMRTKGISQDELAAAINRTRQVVSCYCLGTSKPDFDTLREIASYLDVSVDWLMGLTKSIPIDEDRKVVSNTLGISNDAIDSILFFKGRGNPEIDMLSEIIGNKDFRKAVSFLAVASGVKIGPKGKDNETDIRAIAKAVYNIDSVADGSSIYRVSGRTYLDFLKQQAQGSFYDICNKIVKKMKEQQESAGG